MNTETSTVLAPMAQGQSTPPKPEITGVLTILSPKPGATPEQIMKIMPAEIRATVPCISTARFSSGSRAATARASSSY